MSVEKRQQMIGVLAIKFAKLRTHGDVKMDGSHNPTITEVREAEKFFEMLDFVGLLVPEEPIRPTLHFHRFDESTPAGIRPECVDPECPDK